MGVIGRPSFGINKKNIVPNNVNLEILHTPTSGHVVNKRIGHSVSRMFSKKSIQKNFSSETNQIPISIKETVKDLPQQVKPQPQQVKPQPKQVKPQPKQVKPQPTIQIESGDVFIDKSVEKIDTEPLKLNTEQFKHLTPIKYSYKTSNGKKYKELGFDVKDVAKLYPELVTYNDDGTPLQVQYDCFIPLIVREVQALRERLQYLEQEF